MTNEKETTIINFRLPEHGDYERFSGLKVARLEKGYKINYFQRDGFGEESEGITIYGIEAQGKKIIFQEYDSQGRDLPEFLKKRKEDAYIGRNKDTKIVRFLEKDQEIKKEVQKETYEIVKKIEKGEREKRIQSKKDLEYSLKCLRSNPKKDLILSISRREQIIKSKENIRYLEMIKNYPEMICPIEGGEE